jgi:hypothetical protein
MRSLNLLDEDFEKLFLPVDSPDISDVDGSLQLNLMNFITDEMLSLEGIPLSREELGAIFLATPRKTGD